MKEDEFKEKFNTNLNEWNYLDLEMGLEIPVYYTLDENDNVLLDFESMREEFEAKLSKLSGLLPDSREE